MELRKSTKADLKITKEFAPQITSEVGRHTLVIDDKPMGIFKLKVTDTALEILEFNMSYEAGGHVMPFVKLLFDTYKKPNIICCPLTRFQGLWSMTEPRYEEDGSSLVNHKTFFSAYERMKPMLKSHGVI